MKEDRIIDEIENPLEIGNLSEINHYIISNTDEGILEIKLAGSRKKFFIIAFSILAFLVFFLTLLLINTKGDFLEGLLAILIIVPIGILLLRIVFELFKKIAWSFGPNDLTIINRLNRKKIIPKNTIEYITIEHSVTGNDEYDFDQTFWIILKTKDEIYEDGKLYLMKIEGDSSRKNLEERYETEDVTNPLVESVRIADIISQNWNIRIREDES